MSGEIPEPKIGDSGLVCHPPDTTREGLTVTTVDNQFPNTTPEAPKLKS
jgi:hypothetical protein